ncbi:MAG: hypothetical protein BWY68_00430 [bacterium ADurb.Bin400]|nr:MAG: hypothetical protein BWY68_00430 [bacterium ADurb.Bin400]
MDSQAHNDTTQAQATDDIFSIIGAQDISDEEKGALLAKMIEVVQARTMIRIVESLDEERQQRLEDVVAKDDAEELEEFLNKEVPEFSQIFADEAKKLRSELIVEFTE